MSEEGKDRKKGETNKGNIDTGGGGTQGIKERKSERKRNGKTVYVWEFKER